MNSNFFLVHFSHQYLTLPTLKEKVGKNYEALAGPLRGELDEAQIEQIYKVIAEMPTIHIDLYVRGSIKDEADVERKIQQPPSKDSWLPIHAGMVCLNKFF